MKQCVCVYQKNDEVGYATRPLRQKIFETTNAIRLLFCDLDDEDLDEIDELYKVDSDECARMIMRALDANPKTQYMN